MSIPVEVGGADGPVKVDISRPDGTVRTGVVVLQEAFGITPHIASVADRLAGEGYLTAAPHLFHRTGDPVIAYGDRASIMPRVAPHMRALSPQGLACDIDAALELLRVEGVEAARVAVVGFCMGGSVALATAARLPLAAAASFYGGGILEGRFGLAPLIELAPALASPWIGFYGDRDEGIPVEQVQALGEAAGRAPVPTELHRYPEAGHGFNCDDRDSYHPASAADAWTRMLDWFARHLGGGHPVP